MEECSHPEALRAAQRVAGTPDVADRIIENANQLKTILADVRTAIFLCGRNDVAAVLRECADVFESTIGALQGQVAERDRLAETLKTAVELLENGTDGTYAATRAFCEQARAVLAKHGGRDPSTVGPQPWEPDAAGEI